MLKFVNINFEFYFIAEFALISFQQSIFGYTQSFFMTYGSYGYSNENVVSIVISTYPAFGIVYQGIQSRWIDYN